MWLAYPGKKGQQGPVWPAGLKATKNHTGSVHGRFSAPSLSDPTWLSQNVWLRDMGNLVDDGEMQSMSGAIGGDITVLDYGDIEEDLEEGEIVDEGKAQEAEWRWWAEDIRRAELIEKRKVGV